MPTKINRLPFDQNDRRYTCLCEHIHIRQGARAVAIILNILTVATVIFSLTRSSAVALYSLMSCAFAVVIIGSLTLGVFKEKRLYLVPYLVFQIISVGITTVILLVLVTATAMNSTMIFELAKDIGNIDMHLQQKQLDHAITSFTVLFVLGLCSSVILQVYFFEVIYSFYCFLEERERSFNFNINSPLPAQLQSTSIDLDAGNEPSEF